MQNDISRWVGLVVVAVVTTGLTGCAAFRASTHEVNVDDKVHFDANFDHSDMRNITEEVVNEMLSDPFLRDREEPPVLMIAGV